MNDSIRETIGCDLGDRQRRSWCRGQLPRHVETHQVGHRAEVS